MEFAALGWALARVEGEYPVGVAVVRFLLFTGARKSEALRLRWEHVHGDRGVLPDSKSGPRTIWLATPTRAVVAAQPRRNGCPWVFACDDGRALSIEKPWQVIRKKAGLGSLRLHDHRHSHAAVAVGTGGDGCGDTGFGCWHFCGSQPGLRRRLRCGSYRRWTRRGNPACG